MKHLLTWSQFRLTLGSMKILLALLAFVASNVGFAGGYSSIYVTSARTIYSSTNVGTVTPVTVFASVPDICTELEIFDSSGQTLELMTGAAGFETRIRIIAPGGVGLVRQEVLKGTRVSIRSLSATANAGEGDITCLQH